MDVSLLSDSLLHFQAELLFISEDLKGGLLKAFNGDGEGTGEKLLQCFFEAQNEDTSRINIEAMQKVTNVFGLLAALKDGPGVNLSAINFNQLYGTLRCAYTTGSYLCTHKKIRIVAEKMEDIGRSTLIPGEEELKELPDIVILSHFAKFCVEVVRFCTSIVDHLKFLDPSVSIGRVCNAIKQDIEDIKEKRKSQEQEAERRKVEQEERIKRQKKEIEDLRTWLDGLGGRLENDKHVEVSAKRHPSTGRWFVERITKWLASGHASVSNTHKILWAEGKPGVGKSYLVSAVIDQWHQCPRITDDAVSTIPPTSSVSGITAIAYFYFAYDQRSKQQPTSVYARILRQLFPVVTELEYHLRKLHANLCGDSGEPARRPHASELFSIIQNLPKNVLLIFDALDEASKDFRDDLKMWIGKMGRYNESPCVLITARTNVQKPMTRFGLLETVVVEASDEDMEIYVRAQMKDDADVQRIIKRRYSDEEKAARWEKERISEMIVSLRIQDFRVKKTVKDMEAASRDASSDLGLMYTQTLSQIRESPGESADMAFKTLAWLTLTKRELRSTELVEALAVEPDIPEIDEGAKWDPVDLEQICRGLVVLNGNDQSLHLAFAHLTVQQHFVSAKTFDHLKGEICFILFTYLLKVSRREYIMSVASSDSEDQAEEGPDPSQQRGDSEEESEVVDDLYPAMTEERNITDTDVNSAVPDWWSTMDPLPTQGVTTEVDDGDEDHDMDLQSNGYDLSYETDASHEIPMRIDRITRRRALQRLLWAHLQSAEESEATESDVDSDTTDGQSGLDFEEEDSTVSEDVGDDYDQFFERRSSGSFFNPQQLPSDLSPWILKYDTLSDYAGRYALAHLEELTPDFKLERIVVRFLESVYGRSRTATSSTDGNEGPSLHPYAESITHLAAFVGLQNTIAHVLELPHTRIDEKDCCDRTALIWSLHFGKVDVANQLLDAGADPNSRDCNGDAALCYSSKITDEILLKRLMRMTTSENFTEKVLYLSIRDGNDLLFKMLLEKNLSPNYGHDMTKNSALLDAASSKRPELMISCILAAKSHHELNHSLRNVDGETPLAVCCRELLTSGAGALLKSGADPNIADNQLATPLHHAAKNSKDPQRTLELIKRLIKYGASPAAKDINGRTPLFWYLESCREAPEMDDRPLLRILCPEADLCLCRDSDETTVLHVAARNHRRKAIEWLAKKKKGSGLNAVDSCGKTPLLLIFERKDVELIKSMLAWKPSDALKHLYRGQSLLDKAIEIGNQSIVKQLLQMDDSLISNVEGKEQPAIFTAIQCDDLALFEVLIHYGNINDASLTEDTALHVCARTGSLPMLRAILSAGGKVTSSNTSGKTPLDFALERDEPDLVAELLKHDAIPGLWWPSQYPDTKSAKHLWQSGLQTAIARGKQNSTSGSRFYCDPRWKIYQRQIELKKNFTKDSNECDYLKVDIPGVGSSHVRRIEFQITSHDQGWADDARMNNTKNTYWDTWTWFEVSATRLDEISNKPSEVAPAKLLLHNVTASGHWRTHTRVWDYRDPAPGHNDSDPSLRRWLSLLKARDILHFRCRALYPGWINYVRDAQVKLYYEDGPLPNVVEACKIDVPSLCPPGSVPRVILYAQTHHRSNNTPISLRPIVDQQTGVTHVNIAAVHLNEKPGDITLNAHGVENPIYAELWSDMSYLQKSGVKVMAMLGGAAQGTFRRLDPASTLDFLEYYRYLREWLRSYHFDGIDLDVEEDMSIDGIIRLIDHLKADFPDFIISLAPVAGAMYNSEHLSGFDYELLELRRGHLINWYNVQLYCNHSDPADQLSCIRAIGRRKWPWHKIVLGQSTNPDTCGFVTCEVIDTTLAGVSANICDGSSLGGIMGWEYFNALPGGPEEPWLWAKQVSTSLSKYFGTVSSESPAEETEVQSDAVSGTPVTITETVGIAETATSNTTSVEMTAIDKLGLLSIAHDDSEKVSNTTWREVTNADEFGHLRIAHDDISKTVVSAERNVTVLRDEEMEDVAGGFPAVQDGGEYDRDSFYLHSNEDEADEEVRDEDVLS